MAKISAYGNYESGKSTEEVAQFEETGVIPVSGKYTANGNMETKNVPMSELLGGGSGLPEIGSNDDGKVLTVDTDHAVWAEPSGGKEYHGAAPISITGYSVGNPTVELNYNTDDFDVDQTVSPNQLKLLRPVPSTLAANDGDVLTIDNHASGSLTWTTPGGGGGDAESLAGQGLYADAGKLTVATDDTLRIVDAGYMTDPRYKVSVTNSVPTPGANHADVGKVLTVKTIDNTDSIVWDTRFPTIPSDYSSKDYFLHINQSNGTIEWAEIPAAGS